MTAVTVDVAVTRATHHDDWWASLNHGGLLIAPAKLPTYFGTSLPPLSRHAEERLRREVVRMLDDETHLGTFLDHVFEDLLGFKDGWLKGSQVGAVHAHTAVTGESVRPRRLWIGPRGEKLPVFSPERSVARLGVGRGRRSVSRVVEWMRQAEAPIAVLTNGRQIRLIHAGADYDAFCEWDVELFFDEGAPGPQVTALRQLLSRPAVLSPPADGASRLVEAILASRKGQSELSAILGERVRQAVESLIQASSASLDPLVDGHASGGTADDRHVTPNEIYIAATRVVMRLVVLLFAEARELLPRDNTIYHRSYGLQGLREELDRAAGGRRDRLRHRHAAWPRVLGLFRLVYDGSAHEELPIPAYGGGLFEPGRPDGDGVARALAALERADNALTDEVVHHLLELLTRSAVKVRQGRGSTWVSAPVDFSDLSTEYIGILYEGLLDYELRRAPATDAMVFLDVGHQPALPLDRLREMPPKAIAELLKSLQKEAKSSSGGDDAESDDDTNDEDASDDDDAEDTSDDTSDDAVDASDASDTGNDAAAPDEAREGYDADAIRVIRELATDWARNAVRHAGWTKRGANLDDPEVVAKAKKLIRRLVLPGEWFLVRWGGTRKGAGTFYTRPQLAGPTTRRTLEPLAYSPAKSSTDPETGLEEVEAWEPKKPEEILALKVCDPAMGAGSFLVSALRYLTDALFESLHHHGRLEQKPDKTIARLADGKGAKASSETLPVPQDADDFEERLRARLKRHVVERCLYGVDIDPVAVELARLALWVETMDPRLPFEFLDHKLKVGNSLVGCWFDRFADYPLAAWERDAGDKDHKNFVHHFREVAGAGKGGKGKKKSDAGGRSGDVWTQALKDRRGEIRAEMASVLREKVQPSFTFGDAHANADAVHAQAREALERMHAVAVHDASARAALYATEIRDNPTLRALRRAFDAWCALWFWPGDRLDLAPTPRTFGALSPESAALVDELAAKHRFFHWELEFPDVFDGPKAGFDAIVGNPPWETLQPESKEFFSNFDPLYRAYGKQDALRTQTRLFESDRGIENAWIDYQSGYKSIGNWAKNAGAPFGDAFGSGTAISLGRRESDSLHTHWRADRSRRIALSDPSHPFSSQGEGKPFTYKLFLELAHALLREDGQLGLIVPSGLYTDRGTTALRELFLGRCRWRWLFGFENREKIFDIDSRFKFAPVIVQKGGETRAIRAAFMRRKLEEWDRARPTVLAYPRARVEQFSPKSKAILEIASERDLEVLSKLYENGVPLGDTSERGWGIQYRQGDFNMTSDSKLFTNVTRVESESGSLKDVGVWELDGERVFLPLVQGVMLWDGCCFASEYISGANNRASWKRVDALGASPVRTQFLMSAEARERSSKGSRGSRVGYRMLSNATNERTIVAGLLPDWPCGNSVGVLTQLVDEISVRVCLSAALSSLAFDWQMRRRIAGTNVNWFFMEESYLPSAASMRPIVATAARLSLCGPPMSREWLELTQTEVDLRQLAWRRLWAASPHERTRAKCQVDAAVFHLLGFSEEDIRDVISECDLAVGTAGLDPKGFWRVDKDQPPELRHTVLSLVAFHELQKVGLDAFLNQNDGEGWMLPETLRLADYGLGHDDRAKEHQPVASVLGPRFYDWQLAQGVEESWEECARHAELLDRIVPLPKEEGAEGVGKATPSAKKPQTSFEY